MIPKLPVDRLTVIPLKVHSFFQFPSYPYFTNPYFTRSNSKCAFIGLSPGIMYVQSSV